ncbi:hypothetical protein [Alphabaculovirus altersperidaniae]|uniref:Uncharacterized protein n=1 Tax=Spodoptera eridania nucleopolyhedrovirus TaxID=2315721 RepID=A0ABX6TR04_9ABAC|nr:hypothetical protein QKS47_gp062 [Spodoptera eridania nucleopolyhedrovirus]QNV47803.1 hypothetical protein [Spodoptera eridania nucleopolyhedrovirus]
MALFHPRPLQSIAFSAVVNNNEAYSVYEQTYPTFILNSLWSDYLTSHRISSEGLLMYVKITKDLKGALKCLFEKNKFCPVRQTFEWNIDFNSDFVWSNMTFVIFYWTFMQVDLSKMSKYYMLKFALVYLYMLKTQPMSIPSKLQVYGYNIGGTCDECCDDKYVYESEYYDEELKYDAYLENRNEVIACINELLTHDRFRCSVCGNFLFDSLNSVIEK